MRGGGEWWRWAAAGSGLAGLAVLLVVTVLPLGARDGLQNSADTGQITGFVITMGSAAVALAVWAWRSTRAAHAAAPGADAVQRAKDLLAGAVAEQWTDEALRRSLDDPDPIPVRWRAPERSALMDHPANIETGADQGLWWTASSADIAALADRFRRTRRRRLVILGGPGAGKTTLAVQLLLHLLATRDRHPDEPVPVLLPVSGWDTERHPGLHDWLADRITRDHPRLRSPELGAGVVQALTGQRHVLPVLDGLDELSPPARTAVINALARSLGDDDPLVLTSRTDEFARAVTTAGRVVRSAAVLEPLPLSPAAAADHLARYLPPSDAASWRPVLTALRATVPAAEAAPGSARGPAPALADVAATPLGLWLLRTVSTGPGTDPAELTDPDRFPTAAELRAHLFDELIPALIDTRRPGGDPAEPFRPRRLHDPVQVRRWLSHLAHHLTDQSGAAGDEEGGPGARDFAWWRLAATTRAFTRTTRLALTLTAAVALALTSGAAFGFTDWAENRYLAEKDQYLKGFQLGIAGAVLGLAAGIAFFGGTVSSWAEDGPGFADPRFPRRWAELVRRLMNRLANGVPFVIGAWLLQSVIDGGFSVRLLVFFAWTAFTVVLTYWLMIEIPSRVETPRPSSPVVGPLGGWRADRTLNLFRVAISMLAGGLWVLLFTALLVANGGRTDLWAVMVWFSQGFAVAFACGMTAGFTGRHRAWWAYLVATAKLSRAGHLPRRLMPFLDDCHRLGLLRAVGPVYQFRHAELHDHLAARYRPTT